MHNLRKRFTNGGSQMAATIKDVAKKANVSISTVSRVLSNQMHVSSSTYKRIQDAVAELNYIPNSSAVSLVKKSSTTVLYADSFYKGRPYENPHMFDIISGSSHELRKKGYFLGLLDLDCSKEKAEEQIINAIQSKKADGILINGYYVTPAIEKILLATDFPHICIGKPSFDSMKITSSAATGSAPAAARLFAHFWKIRRIGITDRSSLSASARSFSHRSSTTPS